MSDFHATFGHYTDDVIAALPASDALELSNTLIDWLIAEIRSKEDCTAWNRMITLVRQRLYAALNTPNYVAQKTALFGLLYGKRLSTLDTHADCGWDCALCRHMNLINDLNTHVGDTDPRIPEFDLVLDMPLQVSGVFIIEPGSMGFDALIDQLFPDDDPQEEQQ